MWKFVPSLHLICCLYVLLQFFFPSTALILARSISRKPGKIIVPGSWKKRLQTNPGSLLSLSFLSISIHSQRGTLQCHRTSTRCIRPRDLNIVCFFLWTKNLLLPRNKPGISQPNAYKWRYFSFHKFYPRANRQLHCTPLCLPVPQNMVAAFSQSLHATLAQHAWSARLLVWSNHLIKVRNVVMTKICTITIIIFPKHLRTPVVCWCIW